ncbi:MAG: hypothetical protein ACOH2H_24075 [Cypionkella sp.]
MKQMAKTNRKTAPGKSRVVIAFGLAANAVRLRAILLKGSSNAAFDALALDHFHRESRYLAAPDRAKHQFAVEFVSKG